MTVEESNGKENNHGSMGQFPVGMRVLAVDDDPTCLKLLETLLLRCKYHVTTTGQAVTALKMLRENKDQFDLVISDVHMPDMDGFKLLELVGLEMDLPVIMLSANSETQTVMKGITHGACDYLLKPVRIEELRNIWQHVVRRRKFDSRNRNNHENDEAAQKKQPVNPEGEQGGANRGRKHSKKSREEMDDDGDDSDENSNEHSDSGAQKKPRVVWSVELHRKFVAAVNQLGIDKAVPKKILDLMNVENITRENVASHLQKYRLYLKRLSAESSRQANLAAAFGGRNPSYIHMNSLDTLKSYHSVGRYRQMPSVTTSQPSSLLARMNSPSAFGVHGFLPSQSIQLGQAPNNLGTPMKDIGKFQNTSLGGFSQANMLNGAPVLLQEASKCFPTGPSGNSFANISNSTPLPPANKMLVQSHESSERPFNAYVGESPQFPDLGRCNTWPNAVSSKFPTNTVPNMDSLDHKDLTSHRVGDSISQTTLQVNVPKIESLPSFGLSSGHVPMLGNELQSQVASLASNTAPLPSFDQEALSFNFGSNANSIERSDSQSQNQYNMLNSNLLFNPSINSSLPNLRIDNSVVQRQTLDSSFGTKEMNSSGIGQASVGTLNLQDGRIDQQANGDQLTYNNDFLLGTRKPQNSGGLDDIVDMLKPEHEDAMPFVDGDWELVAIP